MKQSVMVSACLLGKNCRYDGGAKLVPELKGLLKDFKMIPFCPEELGDLPIPRPPAEIVNGTGEDVWLGIAKVVGKNGKDYTGQFTNGARKCLELFLQEHPGFIISKANSPSCGFGKIYDGNFSGRLRDGNGVAVALLLREGAVIYTEQQFLIGSGQILDKNN